MRTQSLRMSHRSSEKMGKGCDTQKEKVANSSSHFFGLAGFWLDEP
jgi:hypothetical protein